MSANVDLVRSIFAAWERADFSSVLWADPEIEFVMADGPEPGSWSGLSQMVEGFRDFLNAWEDYGVEAEEYREVDRECVLVVVRFTGRGRTSGVDLGQVGMKGANVFHLSSRKVTRLSLHWDLDRALADFGLSQDGERPD
jgi:ketosteroid isomerase-like protein